jgi:hypothetical protein
MKKIKAFSIVAVVAALFLAGWAVPPVAATSGVTVSIDAPAGVAPESDFTASINISDITDFDACNYDVTFDDTVLRLDDVTAGLIGSTTVPVDLYNEVTPGTYRVIQNVPGLAGADGSGYLAVLRFHVVGSAGDSSLVGPSNGVISDITAVEIEASWVGGSVSIATEAPPATIVPPAANSPPEAANLPPESNEGEPLLPPPPPAAGSDGVPVLWLVIGGAVFLGLVILFLVARSRAY